MLKSLNVKLTSAKLKEIIGNNNGKPFIFQQFNRHLCKTPNVLKISKRLNFMHVVLLQKFAFFYLNS